MATEYTEMKLTDTVVQFMTASITGLTFSTGASVLKAIHLKSFSDGVIKIKIFILQINNKIADAAEVTEEKKI